MATRPRALYERARDLSERPLRRLPPRVQSALRRAGRRVVPAARRAVNSPLLQPLVSVIVPVYNVEAFLAECLDSLIGQSYRRLQIIAVDDGSPDGSIAILRAYARRDRRIEILRQTNAGLGAARNAGAVKARGRFLMFLDSDDVLVPDAISSYVNSLRRSGSDFAVSSYRRMNAGGTWPAASWIREAHRKTVYATTLAESPDILVNAVAWSKCYRRDFWLRYHFRFPEGVLYEDQAVSARAYALAAHFDLLAKVTLHWRVRHDRSSITQQQASLADLRARLDAAFTSLDELSRSEARIGHDVRLAQLLGNDFPQSIRAAQHSDADFWAVLSEGLSRLVAQASPEVWGRVPAQHRLAIRLVEAGHYDEAIEFIGIGHDDRKRSPALIKDGAVYVQFPERAVLGLPEDDPVLALTESQLGQISGIRSVRWLAEGRLELRGWSYLDNVDTVQAPPQLTAVLTPLTPGHQPFEAEPLRLPVEITPDPAVTAMSKHRYVDYENACFTLTVDGATIPVGPGQPKRWRIDMEVVQAGLHREGPLKGLLVAGSGGRLPGGFLPDGRRAILTYSGRDGLVLAVDYPRATLERAELVDRRLELTVRGQGDFLPREIELVGSVPTVDPAGVKKLRRARRPARAVLRAALRFDPSELSIGTASVVLPDPMAGTDPAAAGVQGSELSVRRPTLWTVRAVSLDGRRAPIGVADPDRLVHQPLANPRLRITAHANLGLIDEARAVRISEVTVRGTTFRMTGLIIGASAPVRIRLSAPHAQAEVIVRANAGGTFEAELSMRSDPWLRGERPLPVGSYQVSAELRAEPDQPGGSPSAGVPVELTEEMISRLPIEFSTDELRGSLQLAAPVGLAVTLSVPLTEAERGARPQEQLQQRLVRRLSSPDKESGAVLFRSYFGETCSCNPLAVHQELRRRDSGHTLYWAVRDHSVAVPDGGVPVIHESVEWYRLLHEAEYYMDNMHQPIYHRKPAHQVQIQTFHGYPFKQMGRSHWAWQNRDAAHIRSYLERAADWDYLVSPATYGTAALVEEFGFPNEVLEIGYPRNDVLQSPESDDVRTRVRANFGIRPDQQVALYAPTFRDHLAQNDFQAAMVDFLDTPQLSAELGPDWVIMVRGHAFNARVATRLGSHGSVLDVTDYPDINDLCLASDVAVLDYSSLRFDYALTGKPMLFMVPDLKLWSESSRGTLFDYPPTAPGPMLDSTGEVAAALQNLDTVRADYAEAYATFRATFCDLDDGHAAERLVDRVFDH